MEADMTREELIAALEKAEAGSRELDRDIALTEGMYPEYANQEIGCFKDPAKACGAGVTWTPPNYTTSIDAALTLVPEGWGHLSGWGKEDDDAPWGGFAVLRPFDDEVEIIDVFGATQALALCIAALKARA